MRIAYLVTGGAGFLGAALIRRLVTAGHRVRSFDDYSRGVPERLRDCAADVECVQGDIRDLDALRRAARGMESIIHLAFINGTEFFYSEPERVLDVGVRGMLNVLDACRAEGIGELFVASSSEVYQHAVVVPTDESVPLTIPDVKNPRYSYAGGKLISELLAMNYGRTDFARVVVFRPHNVYGPAMGWEHVIPQFVLRAIEAISQHPVGPVQFPIQGDGSQTRAFIHIDDFTEGLVVLLERGAHLEVYHIGNPEEVTISDVAHQVIASLGRTAAIVPGPLPQGGTPRRCPDIRKLAGLGFVPQTSLRMGLASTVRWYVEHHHERPMRRSVRQPDAVIASHT